MKHIPTSSSTPVALLTDFGTGDWYVGVMKSCMLKKVPGLTFIDINHSIPPQDIRAAGFVFWNAFPYLPSGCIALLVVDPGVGSNRRILISRIGEVTVVYPDNGILNFVLAEQENAKHFVAPTSYPVPHGPTFHGRDVFAPTVCRILLEPDVSDWAEPTDLPTPINPFATGEQGQVIYVDHFGNLITNLRLKSAPARNLGIGNQIIPFASTFAEVPEGTPLAYIGSSGLVEIAIRNGHAANTFASLNNNQPPIGMECVILSS
ncbi:MAG: SAM-dependent chlorinase/fluorinase [Flavobacteriales bacterium]|nr:SAM-dependent chlorinase/fluorinase [Flavobacteriales bacterium]MCB9447498.1 SAM-dependent chlorinase/fluorinase [Flavobacteriales bacterium]